MKLTIRQLKKQNKALADDRDIWKDKAEHMQDFHHEVCIKNKQLIVCLNEILANNDHIFINKHLIGEG